MYFSISKNHIYLINKKTGEIKIAIDFEKHNNVKTFSIEIY